MPLFDEWGLCPIGLECPRENPILVAPLLLDPAERASNVEAGGHTPPGATEATSGAQVPPAAQEAEAPEAPDGATTGWSNPVPLRWLPPRLGEVAPRQLLRRRCLLVLLRLPPREPCRVLQLLGAAPQSPVGFA